MHTAVLPSSFKSKQLTRSSLRKTHPKLFLTGETPEEDWQERRGCHLEPLGHLEATHGEHGSAQVPCCGTKVRCVRHLAVQVNREGVTFPQLSPSAQTKTPCVPGPFARPQEEGVGGHKPDLCLPGTAPQKTTQFSLASPGHFMKAF